MNDGDLIGRQFGNYRLVRLLGEGSFAQVYLGQHIHIATQAAIKVLATRLSDEELEQFRAEANTFASLRHAHIVRMLDFGVEGRLPYIAMEYAPHGSLRQLYPLGTRLPLETITRYVKQVASALQYAHDQHLIHRDLKPENMLLGQDDALLLADFGVSMEALSTYQQQTGQFSGTASYAAPEQLQGKPRPASDQYALAVVVYEWLCGDRPFHGTSLEIASQHVLTPPPPLRERVSDLPLAVEQVVMTALAKDPKERFARVAAFARALEEAALSAETSRETPDALPQTSPFVSQPSSEPAQPLFPSTIQTADLANRSPLPTPLDEAPLSEGTLAPAKPRVASFGQAGGHLPPQATAQRNRRTGVIVLITLILLAIIGGGIAAGVAIMSGTHSSSRNTPGSTPTDTSSLPSGSQSFTNSDNTFRIAYPSDWEQSDAAHGTGATFKGPDGQTFIISNVGSTQDFTDFTPARFDDDVCTGNEGFDGFGGTTSSTQTVSIGGQDWTQEECESGDGTLHVAVETIIYQDTFFTMVYYSTPSTFDSNRDLYFSPMEQSFTFLI